MPNINAFRPVVHEKKIFINIFLILPLLGPKRDQPIYLNKSESPSPKYVSSQSLVKIGQVVHEKKIFKRFCYISLHKNI